jgi:hypothetical protein
VRSCVLGLILVCFVVLWPACWEPACKNPLRGAPNAEAGAREGVLVQCNVVLTCAAKDGGDKLIPLVGAEDAQIIDRRSAMLNEDACLERAKERGISGRCSKIEVSPKVICLDAPGSNGCGAPGDGTVIIVGSAASGDFRSDPQGAGGTDDDVAGAGDQGGL